MRALVLVLVAVFPATARAAEVVALDAPTPVSAYGGRLLWSQRDAQGAFRLYTRAGGVTARVPVPARRVAFDADLGPNAAHHVAAVYSRCRQDPPPTSGFGAPALYNRGRGCDVYEYDFATGTESRLAAVSSPVATEAWPTIWRARIVFERVYDDRRNTPFLYTQVLGTHGGSRRLPAGPAGQSGVSHVTGLDLRGRRAAFAWTFEGHAEGLDTEIRLDTIGQGARVVAHQHGGGLTQVVLGAPALDDRFVSWAQSCWGDSSGCPQRHWLVRQPSGGGTVQRAPAPAHVVWQARDGGQTYVLQDTQTNGMCMGDPPAGPTCTLRTVTPNYG